MDINEFSVDIEEMKNTFFASRLFFSGWRNFRVCQDSADSIHQLLMCWGYRIPTHHATQIAVFGGVMTHSWSSLSTMTGLKYHPLHGDIPAFFFMGASGGGRGWGWASFPSWLPPQGNSLREQRCAVWEPWKLFGRHGNPTRVLKNFRKVIGRWKTENHLPNAFKCLPGRFSFMWQFLSEIRSLVHYMSGTGFQLQVI